jgi:hypothetical protein
MLDPPILTGLPSLEQALHPEASLDLLLSLADRHPYEVLQNPALDLLALEDPSKWCQLVYTARLMRAEKYLQEGLESTRQTLRARFVAECVEGVLPLYEGRFPEDRRPRRVVELAFAFASYKASADSLRRAGDDARKALYTAYAADAVAVADAAVNLARIDEARAAFHASHAVVIATSHFASNPPEVRLAAKEEQAARLSVLLRPPTPYALRIIQPNKPQEYDDHTQGESSR